MTEKINHEEIPNNEQERNNPNSIGELISIGTEGVKTSPDKVYRGVIGEAAINDIFESGIVRNAQSAGVKKKSRWGETVFWSRGKEGKYHNIQENGYIIEAPFDTANSGTVRMTDITAIYEKTPDGNIINSLDERNQKFAFKKKGLLSRNAQNKQELEIEDKKKIEALREQLGIDPSVK